MVIMDLFVMVAPRVCSTCYYSIRCIRHPFKLNQMQTVFADRQGEEAKVEPFDHPHLGKTCVMLMCGCDWTTNRQSTDCHYQCWICPSSQSENATESELLLSLSNYLLLFSSAPRYSLHTLAISLAIHIHIHCHYFLLLICRELIIMQSNDLQVRLLLLFSEFPIRILKPAYPTTVL